MNRNNTPKNAVIGDSIAQCVKRGGYHHWLVNPEKVAAFSANAKSQATRSGVKTSLASDHCVHGGAVCKVVTCHFTHGDERDGVVHALDTFDDALVPIAEALPNGTVTKDLFYSLRDTMQGTVDNAISTNLDKLSVD